VSPADRDDVVVDLVPLINVTDVERSIRFYEELGFRVVKTYEPEGRLEFAGLEATPSAKLMLGRVDVAGNWEPDDVSPGHLCLYSPDLEALRERLIAAGFEQDPIEEVAGPGPDRRICLRDPDGYGHMAVELFEQSVAADPRP
jgi:catechol 2,3-dioxygenase-like lactoylglutathione lyase family enzyme